MPWRKAIAVVVTIGGGLYFELLASARMLEMTHLEVLRELFG